MTALASLRQLRTGQCYLHVSVQLTSVDGVVAGTVATAVGYSGQGDSHDYQQLILSRSKLNFRSELAIAA